MLISVLISVENVSMDFNRLLLHFSDSSMYIDYTLETKLVIDYLLRGFQEGFQHFTVVYLPKSF